MADEFENAELNELEDDLGEEVTPEEFAVADSELYIDEAERQKAEKAKLPIVAIIAITVAVLFAATCFFIIKFSKDKINTDEPTGTTASQNYNAEVYDGQLYINGVAVDNNDVGISDDEIEEYASNLNSGNVTVNSNVANKYNITTNKAPVVNQGNSGNSGNVGGLPNNSTTKPTTGTIAIKAVDFIGSSKELYVGEKIQLSWRFTPYNTTQKGIIFTSSNEDVATVDHRGYIIAKSIGTTTITVTSKYNKSLSDTYTIKVVGEKTTAEPATLPTWPRPTKPETTAPTTTQPTTTKPTTEEPHIPVGVSDIKLVRGNNRTIKIGTFTTLNCELTPSNATMKDLKFTSSDTGVCIVNEKGMVIGVSTGKAVVTIESKTGTATPVKVNIEVE